MTHETLELLLALGREINLEGTDTIEASGALLLTASCPSTRGYPDGVRTAAYDSAKQRLSAAQETDALLFYGSQQECLRSAISGYWEGR